MDSHKAEEETNAGAVVAPAVTSDECKEGKGSEDWAPVWDDSCDHLFVKYPSIGALRNAVTNLRKTVEFRSLPLPTLTFTGTVKLHGANAGVGWDVKTGRMWTQSRRHVLGEKDLVGFKTHVTKHKATFKAVLMQVLAEEDTSVLIFGTPPLLARCRDACAGAHVAVGALCR